MNEVLSQENYNFSPESEKSLCLFSEDIDSFNFFPLLCFIVEGIRGTVQFNEK